MEVRVKKGDNLWKIAKRFKPAGISTADYVQQIVDANGIEDPDLIQPGEVFTLPGVEGPPTPTARPTPEQMQQRVADFRQTAIRNGAEEGPELDEAVASFEADLLDTPAPADLRRGVQPDIPTAVIDEQGTVTVSDTAPPAPVATMQEIKNREAMIQKAAVNAVGERSEQSPPLPRPRPAFIAQALALPSAADRGNFTLGDPPGLLEEGNIDLSQRPRVPNPDGTFSTVRSASFSIDGREVLVPTLDPMGKQMTDEESVGRFLDTGEHLGIFSSPETATAYSKRLSLGLGGPKHDPDAFIDLGSPRWREVFVEGVNTARYSNMKRRTAQPKPKGPSAALPTLQSLDQMRGMMESGRNIGAVGGGYAKPK